MAENYVQFSYVLTNITPEQAEWCERILTRWEQFIENTDEPMDFEWQLGGANRCEIWMYAQESGTPYNVARFVQRFFKRWRPNAVDYLSWAETCSKPRVGEFSGGAIVFTADEIWVEFADMWAREKIDNLKKKGKVYSDG